MAVVINSSLTGEGSAASDAQVCASELVVKIATTVHAKRMPTKLAMRCSCFLFNLCGGETPLIGLSFGFLGAAVRRPPYAVLPVRLRVGCLFRAWPYW